MVDHHEIDRDRPRLAPLTLLILGQLGRRRRGAATTGAAGACSASADLCASPPKLMYTMICPTSRVLQPAFADFELGLEFRSSLPRVQVYADRDPSFVRVTDRK